MAILVVSPHRPRAQDISRNVAASPSSPSCTNRIDLPEQVVNRRVLPATDLAALIVRAPIAWTRSMGAGVRVAIAGDGDLALVTAIAPAAHVENIHVNKAASVDGVSLAQFLAQRRIDVLAMPVHSEYEASELLGAVRDAVASGIAVIVSSDLKGGIDPMVQEVWLADLHAAGAITVATLSVGGTACRFLYPVDLFAPTMDSPLWYRSGNGSVTAAGVVALLFAASPGVCPATLRQRLVETADPMWQATDLSSCVPRARLDPPPVTTGPQAARSPSPE
jgi:hypothetical protein